MDTDFNPVPPEQVTTPTRAFIEQRIRQSFNNRAVCGEYVRVNHVNLTHGAYDQITALWRQRSGEGGSVEVPVMRLHLFPWSLYVATTQCVINVEVYPSQIAW